MNRLGLRAEELPAFIERLSHCRNVVQPFHLMTHFSQSDEQDTQATQLQIEEFNRLSADLPGERAMANSAGILAWPASRSDWIRPGSCSTAPPRLPVNSPPTMICVRS